ncbi:MAG: response regulator [Ignavibacteriota bacterium]
MPDIQIGLVDDDPSVRKGMARLLRSAGYAVQTFASGEECLASGELAALGCLIVDVHLGGITGFELVSSLKKAGRMRPVIFITAHDEAMTRDALQVAGSPVCLRKPVPAESLLAAVRRHLEVG